MNAIINDRYLKSVEVHFQSLEKEEALKISRANSKKIEDLETVVFKSEDQAEAYCNALAKKEIFKKVMFANIKYYL